MCPDEYEATKQLLKAEPQVDILVGLVGACQNLLVDPYVTFLASEKNQALLKELGAAGIDLSTSVPASAPNEASASSDVEEEDWAAGW